MNGRPRTLSGCFQLHIMAFQRGLRVTALWGAMKAREGRLYLTMSSDQLSAIDEWRRMQMDLPSREEAVRRLVEWAVRQEKGDRLSPVRLARS